MLDKDEDKKKKYIIIDVTARFNTFEQISKKSKTHQNLDVFSLFGIQTLKVKKIATLNCCNKYTNIVYLKKKKNNYTLIALLFLSTFDFDWFLLQVSMKSMLSTFINSLL